MTTPFFGYDTSLPQARAALTASANICISNISAACALGAWLVPHVVLACLDGGASQEFTGPLAPLLCFN
eukprot:672126-Amphidinium_carterae.1